LKVFKSSDFGYSLILNFRFFWFLIATYYIELNLFTHAFKYISNTKQAPALQECYFIIFGT